MKELTINRLKNTDFKEIYGKLISNIEMSEVEYKKLLSLSVLFINSKDKHVNELGYRIIVFYCNKTLDYKPLYDYSINKGLIPISKFIERMEKYQEKFSNYFFYMFYSAYLENYRENEIYLSEEQRDLLDFFKDKKEESLSIVAPTSYGKSELILSMLKRVENKNVCIIVPTKALLAQTKRRIYNERIKNIPQIITHPDMIISKENNIVAVLTQERLFRLMKKEKNLYFDYVFIDEAHNLLSKDHRSILLASVLAILEKRNNNTIFKFLTPFLKDASNLEVEYTNYRIEEFKIKEKMKTERIYYCDFRKSKNRKLEAYDQYMNEFYDIKKVDHSDYIDFIKEMKGEKNIIYLNKPKDIENFAKGLCKKLPRLNNDKLEKACKQLKKYFDKDYLLIPCIRRGFIYHHGSVPDNVRLYVEDLYSKINEIKFVVTSSTLLEGINLPAEKMFILDNRKGLGNLKPAQFKNLIGRVCRFNEVFSINNHDLKKLEPEIYLIGTDYSRDNADFKKFIKNSMNVNKTIKDEPENVLLKNVDITDKNCVEREMAEELIENYESGIIDGYKSKYAQTDVGKSCFYNNINEINILDNEDKLQNNIEEYIINKRKLTDPAEILGFIADNFINLIEEPDKHQNLKRFEYIETQRFYTMFLQWRINNENYKKMIYFFIKYWEKVEKKDDTYVYVGKWGDKSRGGIRKLWTKIDEKNRFERINLAIVRIKDEQDFLDNEIIKYIEVLNDLGLVEKILYDKIKYGTSNKYKINLMRNGFSRSLASSIVDNYEEFWEYDKKNDTVIIDIKIIDEMYENKENEILILEAKYNIRK